MRTCLDVSMPRCFCHSRFEVASPIASTSLTEAPLLGEGPREMAPLVGYGSDVNINTGDALPMNPTYLLILDLLLSKVVFQVFEVVHCGWFVCLIE